MVSWYLQISAPQRPRDTGLPCGEVIIKINRELLPLKLGVFDMLFDGVWFVFWFSVGVACYFLFKFLFLKLYWFVYNKGRLSVIDEVQALSWYKNPDSPETELDAAYRETVRKYNEERKWLKK